MDFVVLGIGLIFLICVIVGIYKGAIKIAVSLSFSSCCIAGCGI